MNPNHSYAHYYLSPSSVSDEFRWNMCIEKLPEKGDWFFAFNPIGFYAGLLIENKKHEAQFSVWSSQGADPGKGFSEKTVYDDDKAIRIKGDYNWELKKPYQFILRFERDGNNKIAILNIQNEDRKEVRVGKQTMPEGWKLNSRIDLFVERLTNKVEPDPLSVIFSDFLPAPEKLTGVENECENPLNLTISIGNNSIAFRNCNISG